MKKATAKKAGNAVVIPKKEIWPIGRLKAYEQNARIIGKTAINKVAESIERNGFLQDIVVAADGIVLAGHTRLFAAKQIGLTEIPVTIAEHLNEAEQRQYRLADNRSHEETEWQMEFLALEFEDLKSLGADLSFTSFDQQEIDRILSGHRADQIDADETPELEETAISKLGDIWVLGAHLLACGDSTDPATVAALLGGVKPNLMVTDPPYGANYDASWRNEAAAKGLIGQKKSTRATGKVLNDDRADWREAWALFPGDVMYVWHDGRFGNKVQDGIEATGFDIRAQLIWAKSNMVISRGHYHGKHEPCFYAVRKGATGAWEGGRTQTTLWAIDKPLKSETGHSTQKPIECMRLPIQNNSVTGDIIYDPFSGSGTTIMAAEVLDRRCFAIELNPLYVDMAVRRWENFTGKKATLKKVAKETSRGKKA